MAVKQKPDPAIVKKAAKALPNKNTPPVLVKMSARIMADEKNAPEPHKPEPTKPRKQAAKKRSK